VGIDDPRNRPPEARPDDPDRASSALSGEGPFAAFLDLYTRDRHALVRYARRGGANLEDAEDIVDESFLRIFQRYGRGVEMPEQGARAYLWAVVRNATVDFHRRKARLQTAISRAVEEADSDLRAGARLGTGASAFPVGPSPEEAVLVSETVKEALGLALELTPRPAAMLVLDAVGLSTEEIGVAVGVSSGTVSRTVARARKEVGRRTKRAEAQSGRARSAYGSSAVTELVARVVDVDDETLGVLARDAARPEADAELEARLPIDAVVPEDRGNVSVGSRLLWRVEQWTEADGSRAGRSRISLLRDGGDVATEADSREIGEIAAMLDAFVDLPEHER
jgi:RNA polymerase sigma factor (sigma-70 family)